MKIENTKAQMRKGVLEYCILSVLKDEDAYVAEILATLKDAKMLVVEGTIYPLLTRLKNAGLLDYRKLQRYLEAIKRSFTDSQGRSEIIADIEARIAELFNERVQNDKQVIRIKEVDEVISIMGQPEDYIVDDEIFEDEAPNNYQNKSNK